MRDPAREGAGSRAGQAASLTSSFGGPETAMVCSTVYFWAESLAPVSIGVRFRLPRVTG